MEIDTTTAYDATRDVAERLRDADRPEHPALARLHDQLNSDQAREITSYDRMHHRHNRH